MIMKNKYILLLFCRSLVCPFLILWKGQLRKRKTEQVKSKSDYEKLLKGKSNCMESKGLMNLYWIENKIYMEIPKAVLGKRLLMGGVVDKVSNPQESFRDFALPLLCR